MTATRLEKATTVDIILSVVLPFWGFVVGLIALAKREKRRGLTMIAISVAVLATYLILTSR